MCVFVFIFIYLFILVIRKLQPMMYMMLSAPKKFQNLVFILYPVQSKPTIAFI